MKPFDVYRKELTIKGSLVNPYTMQDAINLMVENRVEVDNLVTHRFGLDQFDRAINTYAEDDNRIKFMMEP